MSISIPPHLTPLLLTTLRILPLLGSTASLTHAYMEYVTTSSFLTPAPTSSILTKRIANAKTASADPPSATAAKELEAAKEKAIPAWFVNFFNRAVWSVIGFNGLTTLSAIANLYFFPEALGEAKSLYVTGLGCAIAHYVFVIFVQPSIEALFKKGVAQGKGQVEDGGRSAVSWLREWVRAHSWRMWSVDLLAWGCFLGGVVRVFSVYV
ncbi:hypothetical protein BDV96DRAFT_587526 [Lophiotrema nucula]|uniref:Integral membrane protein-like protein n=1 Tax=Lophiotrema nucula TaxID=690887 RepID=A0A6A5YPG1_9PLEO|nr:hypothetical protein BDV96DRAFT_587526 [Lophiotrema nucula]